MGIVENGLDFFGMKHKKVTLLKGPHEDVSQLRVPKGIRGSALFIHITECSQQTEKENQFHRTTTILQS